MTLTQEVMLNEISLLMLEADRLEREYDEKMSPMDKIYLSCISRLDILFHKVGLIKKSKKENPVVKLMGRC